jgi:YidC/Oxa1 family membrane protein insertase
MKLYQQAGINPLMGCLPVVLQLPMFFALYSVLKSIAEWKVGQAPKYGLTLQMVESAQKAKILGATVADKFLFTGTLHVPLHAKAVILVAVLISMTTTFLTVRQSMKRGMMPAATPDNPMGQSQKYMMYFMPLFALSGLYWPFGLVLYWVTTNCWTLLQQWVIFRRFPRPAAAGAAATAAAGSPAAAPVVSVRPKRSAGAKPRSALGPGTSGEDAPAAGQGGSGAGAESNGAASNGAAQRQPNGAQPSGKNRKPAPPGAGSPAGKGSGRAGSARQGTSRQGTSRQSAQGAQPAANGGGAGGVLRRLGKRAEPEPEPTAAEIKLVRQQKQRQSRSKRSGKR